MGDSQKDNNQAQINRRILKEKVVALVKEFVKEKGDMSYRDLIRIFGPSNPIDVDSVATALAQEVINFTTYDHP